MRIRGRVVDALALAAPAIFLLVFLAWPIFAMLRLAAPTADLGSWERGRLVVSLRLGALTALLALLFGMPLAWLLGTRAFRGRKVLRALVTVPFVMPVVVVAGGLLVLLGPRGIVAEALGVSFSFAGTTMALLVANTIYNVPLVVRLVGDAWAHLDPRQEEVAATLGAGRARRFFTVTLPRLGPSLGAALLLAFLFGFTSFGTVLFLGDPVTDATLEVAIYHDGVALFDLPAAASLALLQLLVTFAAALTYAWLARRSASQERPVDEAVALRPLSWRAAPVILLALAVAFALLAPLAGILWRALDTPAGFGVGAFTRIFTNSGALLFVPPARAIVNSLRFAALAVLIAVPLGLLAARAASRAGPALDAVWMLPLGASAVTLSLGLLLIFPWRIHTPIVFLDVDLRATAALLVLVHVLVAFPFVARALTGPLRARDPAFAEAARTLGASRWQRARWVELPLLSPALLVAAVLAASVSLGEFAGALILLRPEFGTVPAEIFRYVSETKPDPWLAPMAAALASILMLLDILAFIALERLRPGRSGGF